MNFGFKSFEVVTSVAKISFLGCPFPEIVPILGKEFVLPGQKWNAI